MSVELQRDWLWGDPITADASGFGRVIEATDPATGIVHAAKFVPKSPGATRELLLADLDGVRNVVPVVDSGEVGDEYVLVMPMAQTSLRRHIDTNGPLDPKAALTVLIDVAEALVDLSGKIVHRDIKPANVLLLDGKWCLMDFGISRYADASTELGVTQKGSLTPQYAAPEQWLNEHATAATDIYAFGVMAYELLQGNLPFNGPQVADFRKQHIQDAPPQLSTGGVLASLVLECLYKSMQSRPPAANVLARLAQARDDVAASRWERLIAANHTVVRQQADAEAESLRLKTEAERRDQLFRDAVTGWQVISKEFHEIIDKYMGAAEMNIRGDRHWNVELNGAKFGISFPKQCEPRDEIPFDIIATSTVSVLLPKMTSAGWEGRSHSLYFADALSVGEYGWYETAFMKTPFGNDGRFADQEPFSKDDVASVELQYALTGVLGRLQVAWEFTRITPGACDEFVQRWLEWFAAASQNQLRRPNQMPEKNVPHTTGAVISDALRCHLVTPQRITVRCSGDSDGLRRSTHGDGGCRRCALRSSSCRGRRAHR